LAFFVVTSELPDLSLGLPTILSMIIPIDCLFYFDGRYFVFLCSIELIPSTITSTVGSLQIFLRFDSLLRLIDLITTPIILTGILRFLQSPDLFTSSLISTVVRLHHVTPLFYRCFPNSVPSPGSTWASTLLGSDDVSSHHGW